MDARVNPTLKQRRPGTDIAPAQPRLSATMIKIKQDYERSLAPRQSLPTPRRTSF